MRSKSNDAMGQRERERAREKERKIGYTRISITEHRHIGGRSSVDVNVFSRTLKGSFLYTQARSLKDMVQIT